MAAWIDVDLLQQYTHTAYHNLLLWTTVFILIRKKKAQYLTICRSQIEQTGALSISYADWVRNYFSVNNIVKVCLFSSLPIIRKVSLCYCLSVARKLLTFLLTLFYITIYIKSGRLWVICRHLCTDN